MDGEPGSRQVTHYHYTGWPDFGNPPTEGFLDLIHTIPPPERSKPIVAHCSAGLGRSGVFVTVHSALECHRDKRKVDVEQIVRSLRQQRDGMIQTQVQYRFCFEAIAEALVPAQSEQEDRPLSQRPPSDLEAPPPYTHQDTSTSPPHPSIDASSSGISPPPPTSTPPPPISQPDTPIKHSIVVTPNAEAVELEPERPPSLPSRSQRLSSSDMELIQRKLSTMAESGTEGSGRKRDPQARESVAKPEPPRTSPPAELSPPILDKQSSTSTASDQSPLSTTPELSQCSTPPEPSLTSVTPEQSLPPTPPEESPPSSPETEQPPTPPVSSPPKVTRKEAFKGFEVPKFPSIDIESDKEQEVVGFEIGDDQVLEEKAYKKEEKKSTTEDKPKPKQKYKWQPKSPAAPKMERKSPVKYPVADVSGRDEPRGEERKEAVGKLVIPSIFGGGSNATPSPAASPKLPVKRFIRQDASTTQQSPSPGSQPRRSPSLNLSRFEKTLQNKTTINVIQQPEVPQPTPSPKRIGSVDLAKFEGSLSASPTRKPPSYARRVLPPVAQPSTQTESRSSSGGGSGSTPPIFRRVREIQALSQQAQKSTPSYKIPTQHQQHNESVATPSYKLPSPVHKQVKPVESKPQTDTSGNVAKLLARFQGQ